MKNNTENIIAVSASDNKLSSKIEECFGKSVYYFMADLNKGSYSFIKNPYLELEKMSGKKAALYLAGLGVRTVMSSNFGVEVKKIFDKHNIRTVILDPQFKLIKEIKIFSGLKKSDT